MYPPYENSTTRTAIVHVQCIQLMTLAYSQKYLFLDIIGLLPEILDETFDGYVHANFHTNTVLTLFQNLTIRCQKVEISSFLT